MVSKPTAIYFVLHVINARAMTNIAGKRFPKILKIFLVRVRVKIPRRMNRSATAPETLIFNQNKRYGNDESKPF